ncbi:site-specific DNA-methyltransferase [Roseovarius aestuariivivens]|uniref:site-specific DNA-methyltransferase n=1 Tax=Roseovarius aestuariivivens TaxID=1888910 RepID=UPI00108074D7|nr:DNA methyltransferase [Roseovarius aestuariivivens]
MNELQITYRPTAALSANPRNARTHSARQIRQIGRSIETFGFVNPVLVDEQDVIIAGHGRLEASEKLGLDRIPVVQIPGLSEAQKRGLMLADNRIAENAGWDSNMLAQELSDLSAIELDFDLEVTGFDVAEIDIAIHAVDDDDGAPEAAPEPDPDMPVITSTGDLWQLGPHRVACGNARDAEVFHHLMGDDRADAGFTDPPYNVPIRGHVSGKGNVTHREFAEASGEMTPAEFRVFLDETLGNAAAVSRPGAVWFVCTDWRHACDMIGAGQTGFGPQLNLCVWCKTNGGMGSLYRSQHELVCVFGKSGARHRNNVQLGRFGRNRTNVWRYPGVNTFREGRMEELRAHPTAKPVAMISDALIDVTRRGDIVLDPFAGAGATLMAAEQTGRHARLLEIDPAYVDTMLRRWRAATGEDPIRLNDKAGFSTLEGEANHEQ